MDDRTEEWRRGMREAAELCLSYARTARLPDPFNDPDKAEQRAIAYETAAEVITLRLTESPKLRSEEVVGRAMDEAPPKSQAH